MSRIGAEHLMLSMSRGSSVKDALDLLSDDIQFKRLVIPGVIVRPENEGGTIGLPRPTCLEQHLPKDRQPTPEDWRRAWEACGGTKG